MPYQTQWTASSVPSTVMSSRASLTARHSSSLDEAPATPSVEDLADLLLPEEEDDLLVREKVIDVTPMTEEQALVQTDLLGHDFYVFENATTGLINVVYHRKNGGYGIIKPRIETLDE